MARTRKHSHELVLWAVSVLIFVHHDVLETPGVVVTNFRGRLQQANGLEQQVVEVKGIGLAQLLAILLVDVGHTFGLGVSRLQIDFLGIEHVILCPGDSRKHGAWRELLVIYSEAAHHAFHDLLLITLVVNDETLGVADRWLAGSG